MSSSFKELTSPFDLLRSSKFLQIRLGQMLLLQLGNGWESVLDSFMISSLGLCLRAATGAGVGVTTRADTVVQVLRLRLGTRRLGPGECSDQQLS